MKTFLIKIAIFLSLFVLIYIGVFSMVDKGIKSSEYQDYAEWNAIYSGEIDADLLIMGSSRAWRQVDPEIIDKNLGVNSFNMGIDGYHIPMQLTKYQIYKEHNILPSEIVYVVDHFSMDKREDLFNKYQFAPYFLDTLLTNRLKEYEGFKWQHFNAQYFQYSGGKEICLAGIAQFLGLKKFQSNKYKGFRAKDQAWEKEFDLELAENPKGKRAGIKVEVVREFQAFLKNETIKGTKVTVVYAPDYLAFQDYIINRDSIMNIYRSTCESLNIDFLDYSKHDLCKDKAYFYNPTHLNLKGAKIFSEDLAQKIGVLRGE
jgi:hypothetical protein